MTEDQETGIDLLLTLGVLGNEKWKRARSVVGVVVVRAAKSHGLKLRGVEETFIMIMRQSHRD